MVHGVVQGQGQKGKGKILTEIVQTNQLKIKKCCTIKALTVCASERVSSSVSVSLNIVCQMHGHLGREGAK